MTTSRVRQIAKLFSKISGSRLERCKDPLGAPALTWVVLTFFNFPFLFLIWPPYPLVFDNKHSPSRDKTKPPMPPNHSPLSPFIFLFFYSSCLTLSNNAYPDTNHAAAVCSCFYLIMVFPLCAYAYTSPASPRSPLLYKHRHCQQVACMYISPPSYPSRRASRSWFLSEVSFSSRSLLSQRLLGGTVVYTGLGDLPHFCFSYVAPASFLSLSAIVWWNRCPHRLDRSLAFSLFSSLSSLFALWRYSELLQR